MYRVFTYQTKAAHLKTTWVYAARQNDLRSKVVASGGKILAESAVETSGILGQAVKTQHKEIQATLEVGK